ncbi:hypothetical protein BFS06_14175 [Clostridium perfringens]|uniref:DUF4160 domain-containing protein n=1 Tax=Clostridium perfringens TaxID=1502 RepID=A0A140GRH7_CLOPF|nr:DUF4160 domain-containing protein [Clostridium perfringens]AMN31136.1 hypothetical protein JFP838_pA0220 [Clostridium perfringens]TBX14353.1 hypothetical protein BFS06_14175 [Clostridium perfringens]
MGELFRLYDFKVCMYNGDTDKHKEPHFHVYTNNGKSATISVSTGKILSGELDRKTLKIIQSILLKNKELFWDRWNNAVAFKKINRIDIKG